MHVTSDGSHLITLCNAWPKDKIIISDLSGNLISSFDTPGAFTFGATYNGSRNRIIFSGGQEYDGNLYEMNPLDGSLSGPLVQTGFTQPFLAYDGTNILASFSASGTHGVLTIPISKFDANTYDYLGTISVTVNTGTDVNGTGSMIAAHGGNLYIALGIPEFNIVYQFDSGLNLAGEIIIAQINPGQGIGALTFIKDDLFVLNVSTDELYRYTLLPTPELIGEWMPLSQTCKNTKSGTKCKIKGNFKMQNIGNLGAKASHVHFYLSRTNYYEAENILLKSVSTGGIKAGKGKRIGLNYNFPTGVNATGKYITTVIDIYNSSTGRNETNNIVVFGPIE